MAIAHTLFLVLTSALLLVTPQLHNFGAFGIGAYMLICAAYALPTYAVTPRWLICTVAIGIGYIAISYLNALPDSWTQLYQRHAIFQQAFWIFAIIPFVMAHYRFWHETISSGKTPIVMLTLFIVSTLTILLSPNKAGEMLRVTNLTNAAIFFQLTLSHFLIGGERTPLRNIALFALTPVLVLFASNVQPVLALIALMAFALTPWLKLTLWTIVGALLAAPVAVQFVSAHDVLQYDSNSAIRVLFWQDGMSAFLQSYGIGIGFGKEIVTNFYQIFNREQWSYSEWIWGNIHNSILSNFARLGLLGGLSFCAFLLLDAAPRWRVDSPTARHLCFVFILPLLSMSVNPGLESPFFLVGICAAFGFVIARSTQLSGARMSNRALIGYTNSHATVASHRHRSNYLEPGKE
jgi:hypothetical protein